jgi:phosphoglycolate phosphatase-like HAD superfamily hydrolase
VRVGVATIKPQALAELVLETIGLREHVDVVHGRTDDMDPRTKTDLLRSAFDDLPGPAPLFVGDHDNDEEAAAALGMPFLRFPQASWDDVRRAVLVTR